MRTSWKKKANAEMGVGTMIIFIAMVLVAAVAASVLISTANKVREQAQNTGEQAINDVASGFVVLDLTGQVNSDMSSINGLSVQVRLQAGAPPINMDTTTVQFISGSTNNMLHMKAVIEPFSGTNAFDGGFTGDFEYDNGTQTCSGGGVYTGLVNGKGPYTTTTDGEFSGSLMGTKWFSGLMNISGIPGWTGWWGEMNASQASGNYSGWFQVLGTGTGNLIVIQSPTSTTYVAEQTLAKMTGGATWTVNNYVISQGDMITISISNDLGNLDLRFMQSGTIKILPAYGSPTIINFVTPSYYDTDYVNLK